ncbi:MAG: DUF1080 domain-containing protein [Flavisolibacter sp.]
MNRASIFIAFISFALISCNASDTKKTSETTLDSTAQNKSDWTPLFDGVSRKGWHSYGKDSLGSAWKVEDSTLHLDASVKQDWQTRNGGDIVTDEDFENFDLKLEWKISKAGNSGIMFYVVEDTSKYHYPWESGPEMQIADNIGHPDGKNPITSAGSLYDLIPVSKNAVVKPAGEWNAVEIRADKGRLDLFMNGQNIISTILWDNDWKKLIAGSKFKDMKGFGTFKKGKIALQDHGADVWFRNIMIKKL